MKALSQAVSVWAPWTLLGYAVTAAGGFHLHVIELCPLGQLLESLQVESLPAGTGL